MTLVHLRRQLHYFLHEPNTAAAKFFSGIIGLLIIVSICFIPLHFLDIPAKTEDFLNLFEFITVVIFTLEYLLRVWSAAYPLRYIFSWFGIIDLTAIVPFYVDQALNGFAASYIFLALRVLRLLKLGKTYHVERRSVARISKKSHGDFRVLQDEEIQQIVHKHPIVFLIALIPVLMFTSIGMSILVLWSSHKIALSLAICLLVLSVLFFFKAWLDFHYDVIYITNHRIILQNRQLFGIKLNDIAYESITNIRPDTANFLHFLFGFGDVQIETAAASHNKIFDGVPDQHGVASQISSHRKRALNEITAIKNRT